MGNGDVIVGSEIIIGKADYNWIKSRYADKLIFPNPDYEKKLRMGKWLGNTPEKLSLLERRGSYVAMPFGMLPYIFKDKLAYNSVSAAFKSPQERFLYESNIKPYPYQEKAIEAALKARQGIVVAPCGAGKTMIGLEIAARLGLKTLWLTHTTELLNQSMARAKSVFNLKSEDYGTITGGKIDIGKVITFATVQTMCKVDLTKLRHEWNVIIVDEAHRVSGTPTKITMFSRVLSSLCARYKYGLTATPKRSDGLIGCMYALIGPKVCEIEKSEVAETTVPVNVEIRQTGFSPDIEDCTNPDGTINYQALVNEIVCDNERNGLLAECIEQSDGTCLVLTDRIAHIKILRDLLKCSCVTITGTSKNREEVLKKIKSKSVKCLIATYALAKEGLDIPTLNNLVMATPQKNEVIVTQSAGRVARKADGKDFGKIYDFCDDFGILYSWQKKRKSIYKKQGYTVEEKF